MSKQIVSVLKNCDDNILKKTTLDFNEKAAWMIIMMLSNDYILAEDAVEFVKSCDVSAFNEKTAWMMKNSDISTLSKEVIFAFSE